MKVEVQKFGPYSLSDSEIESIQRNDCFRKPVDAFYYVYWYEGYSGELVAVCHDHNTPDRWYIQEIGHCSCFGPLDQLRQDMPCTLEQIIELMEKRHKAGEYPYNLDGIEEMIDYLKKPEAGFKWFNFNPNALTPGGDPAYDCPKCRHYLAGHCYGVEHRWRYNYCCNCGTRLFYPGDEPFEEGEL